MSGARRARLAALSAAGLLAGLTFLGSGSAVAQDCTEVPPPAGCPPTTISTTTTTVPTTTTTVPTTTTTFRSTTTTARQSATTVEQVVTTTTTTLDVSTSIDVLVPGDGTEGAESTTTTTQTPTTISSDGASDATLLTIIIGGLVMLALAVSILTWRYWAATRPPPASTVGSEHG